jgi:hypothetical protein
VAGTKINDSTLAAGPTLASISSSSVVTVAGLHNVSAAAGGLNFKQRGRVQPASAQPARVHPRDLPAAYEPPVGSAPAD